MERTQQARQALRTVQDIPFVWDIAFVEVFENEKGGFDIVIGNPPYVRQERIADPQLQREQVTPENKREYKAKLARSVYHAWPRFFGYKPGRDTAARKLDAKSDLYVYFYFLGLNLLNSKGASSFITSNSWLDVGYGKDLQEFLLKHSHVKMVLDNRAKRSFSQADINTVIVLLAPPDDHREGGLERIARFVMFFRPFEYVLFPEVFWSIEDAKGRESSELLRINSVAQRTLLEEGVEEPEDEEETKPVRGPLIKVARYVGNKWGGKYLRAPDILYNLARTGRLVSLEPDVAQVITVAWSRKGLNEQIIVPRDSAGSRRDPTIDVIKSPKELSRIIIGPQDLKFRLRLIHQIEKEVKTASVLWVDIRGDKHVCHYNPEKIAFTHNFHGIVANEPANALFLCGLLNSTLVWLVVEVLGRSGLGGGGIRILVNDLKTTKLIPDPSAFSRQEKTTIEQLVTNHLGNRRIGSVFDELGLPESQPGNSVQPNDIVPDRVKPDRLELDRLVSRALGLDMNSQLEIYRAVYQVARERIAKVDSVRGPSSRKRLEAVAKVRGIWQTEPGGIDEVDEEE